MHLIYCHPRLQQNLSFVILEAQGNNVYLIPSVIRILTFCTHLPGVGYTTGAVVVFRGTWDSDVDLWWVSDILCLHLRLRALASKHRFTEGDLLIAVENSTSGGLPQQQAALRVSVQCSKEILLYTTTLAK